MKRFHPHTIRGTARLALAAVALGVAGAAHTASGDPPGDPCAKERAALPQLPQPAGTSGPAALDLQHPQYGDRLAELYLCHAHAATSHVAAPGARRGRPIGPPAH